MPFPWRSFLKIYLFTAVAVGLLLGSFYAAIQTKNVKAQSPQYAIQVFDPGGNYLPDFKPAVTQAGSKLIFTFPKQRSFRPGKYTVRFFIVKSGVVYVSEEDFSWGVIALNFNKTIYNLGDEAKIGFSTLDDLGHTLCDAEAQMSIESPNGKTVVLATSDGTILKSPACSESSITNVPDYFVSMQVGQIGQYKTFLIVSTANGTRHTEDSFEVQAPPAFDIERLGPTRIYPPAIYNMTLNIVPTKDWRGEIIETVPSSFQIGEESTQRTSPISTPENIIESNPIVDLFKSILPGNEQSETAKQKTDIWQSKISLPKIMEQGDTKQIFWDAVLKAGEPSSISYSFKAPDISPEFYLLGPLALRS